MKQIIFILALLCSLYANGQPGYPSQPVVSNLKSLEYFVDKDPGIGNGRGIALPATSEASSFQFQADLSGLPSGFHRVFLRSLDMNNRQSFLSWVFFDNYILPPYSTSKARGNLSAMEYYFDTDPGFGNGKPITLPAVTEAASQSLSINVTGLTPGVHKIFIRSKDADGRWSLVSLAQFDNTALNPYPSAPPAAPPIGEMEYYFDTDPGFGNGTAITFTAGTDITNFSVDIPLNSISQGAHTFYIRSRQNPWSLSAFVPFLYSSTLPVTWLYVQGEIKADKTYIDWATATEEETDKFLVEHSTDGRKFNVIGQVAAAGNSSSTSKYRFVHNTPEKGMNYYRLKQLDKNGRFTYSKALHLLYQPDRQEVIIAPNPVADNMYIIAGAENKLVKMEMYDAMGKQILSRQLNTGQQVYSIDIASLSKGMYIVKVYDEKKETSHRILKQ